MGLGSAAAWKECLQAYGLNESSAITYRGNPVDRAEAIAKAGIPLLHIVAENDRVVPPAENTYLLRTRLEKLGHRLAVMSVAEGTEKSNGHHFTHPAPRQVVRFIVRHTATAPLAPQQLLDNASRILFLGDSITMGGRYVADFDAWLTATRGAGAPLVINAGLSSETVSGLSEEGHAGGRFPRPVLRERLQRVLEVAKPDLVFACYGINCGIYQPFDEERFAAYQTGIRELKAAVEQRGGKLVVITPPFYDDLRRPLEGFSYNQVLKRYSQWLLEQAERDPAGWHVVDLHSAMSAEVDRQRNVSPEFYFQRDGVHPTAEGHWFMARQLFRWAGDSTAADAKTPQQWLDARQLPAEFVELANRRMTIRRDAYVSAAGHKRPGIRTGMPIDQAERAASEITRKLFELVP